MAKTDIRKHDLPDTASTTTGVRSTRTRPAVHRYDPHAGDGCRAKGQFRPSRHPHGAGPRRLHAVAGGAPLRLRRSQMAEPRPLRAVERPCVHDALRAPASGARARPRRGRPAGGQPRRHQAVSSAWQPLPGPSRIWRNAGRRSHDRPARAGLRQQRRHGDRRPLSWRAASIGRIFRCSISTSTLSAATAI